jgi:hypothetical protein
MIESNKSLIESIATKKLNIEKLDELIENKRVTDNAITSINTRIKNIISELEKIKNRYEKMVNENIIIPGYVGPGCALKNLGDFVRNAVNEIKKIKDDNVHNKKEEKEIKAKVDLVTINMTNMIEFNSNKMKELTTTKDKEINSLLDNKLKTYKEQSLIVNQNLVDNQNKIEEKIKEIGIEIEKINDNKLDVNTIINNKFEEINKKEEEMNIKLLSALEEAKEFQNMKKELNDLIKTINSRLDDINEKPQNKINQKNFGNKPNNINSFRTTTKNNNLPDINKVNHTLSPNNYLNQSTKRKITILQKTEKNTISNNSSDKKSYRK